MFQYMHVIVQYYQALHNIKYCFLKQAHIEADIKNIVSIEVSTKNDLNDPYFETCFVININVLISNSY